jgi:hypothetical protein
VATHIRNIVFGCPDGTWEGDHWEGAPRELALFYAELLGMRIMREDWLVIARDADSFPRLAFGEGPSDIYVAPRWPDPEFPQQVHLDISVPDPEAAEALVLRTGARPLQDTETYRSYADPVGHPFCLYPEASEGSRAGEPAGHISRVVFDCPDPHALASFYADLVGMPSRTEESSDRVVISKDEYSFPMLAFQRVAEYRAPRWPDPAYPQQLHLDLHVDDGAAASALAERLGATRLPAMGGSCPVFADLAAHPFCLCSPGQ